MIGNVSAPLSFGEVSQSHGDPCHSVVNVKVTRPQSANDGQTPVVNDDNSPARMAGGIKAGSAVGKEAAIKSRRKIKVIAAKPKRVVSRTDHV